MNEKRNKIKDKKEKEERKRDKSNGLSKYKNVFREIVVKMKRKKKT